MSRIVKLLLGMMLFTSSTTKVMADPITGFIEGWLWGDSIGDYKGPCPPPVPPILTKPGVPFEDPAREKARQEYMNAVITCRTDKPPTPDELCSKGKPPSGLGPECGNYCKFCSGTAPYTTNPINGTDPDDPQSAGDTTNNVANSVNTALSLVLLGVKQMEAACSTAGGACISGPFRDAINCMKGIMTNMVDLGNSLKGPMSSEEAANAICNMIQSMNTCRDMAMNFGNQGLPGADTTLGKIGGAIAGSFRDPLAGGATACMLAQMGAKKIKCVSWKNACDDAGWAGQPLLPMRGGGGYGSEGDGGSCSANDPLSDFNGCGR